MLRRCFLKFGYIGFRINFVSLHRTGCVNVVVGGVTLTVWHLQSGILFVSFYLSRLVNQYIKITKQGTYVWKQLNIKT